MTVSLKGRNRGKQYGTDKTWQVTSPGDEGKYAENDIVVLNLGNQEDGEATERNEGIGREKMTVSLGAPLVEEIGACSGLSIDV